MTRAGPLCLFGMLSVGGCNRDDDFAEIIECEGGEYSETEHAVWAVEARVRTLVENGCLPAEVVPPLGGVREVAEVDGWGRHVYLEWFPGNLGVRPISFGADGEPRTGDETRGELIRIEVGCPGRPG